MRAVVLCCDGMFQRYLLANVARRMNLAGVVFQCSTQPLGNARPRWGLLLRPLALLRHIIGRAVIRLEQAHAAELFRPLRSVVESTPLECPQLIVADVNDPEAFEFVQRLAPDVILVNGTRLIRSPLREYGSSRPLGMINLHTGLSPYARGGNCNLHMLREGRPELVGVTVHHIDAGIDSGDLILTARPELELRDTFERIETKVFVAGVSMLISAVRLLQQGRAPRVSQWAEGKLFLRRTGYVYHPWQRYEVRRAIDGGLIRDYLANKQRRDQGIQLVEAHSGCFVES